MRVFLFLLASSLVSAGQFTTSLGDSYPYIISAITTDSAGNTYVVGSRMLTTSGTVTVNMSTNLGAGTDVFVSKLDPNGNLLFTDTFAGKGSDTGAAIALDPSGNIYIGGATTSPDFPLSEALQTQSNSNGTGFIIKLTNDGTTILYSTYFGGALGQSSVSGLATDAKGNLYLTGTTTSTDFPNIGSALSQGSSGAIYASISAAGDKILYAGANFDGPTPSQGGFNTVGIGVAVDASGNAYFVYNDGAGSIYAPDGNLTKFDPSGKILFSANLGSYVSALAVDAAGNIYVGLGINGPVQASIEKFDSNLNNSWTNTLQSGATSIASITVDSAGSVWATGTTGSAAFPNTNGWTTGTDFLVGVNASGSQLIYSGLYPTFTVQQAVSVDPLGLVHVAGKNAFVASIDPQAAPAKNIFMFQNAFGGNGTARVSPAEVVAIYGPGIGPATAVSATPTNGFYPTTLGGVEVSVNGTNIPLLYVSANQINAVIPMGVKANSAATVRVTNGTATSADYTVRIVGSAPAGNPTIVNQDGTINSGSNPAPGGSIVTFWVTGFQFSFPGLADGQVATTANNDACYALESAGCSIIAQGLISPHPPGPSLPTTVLYAGAAPGIVAGVTQFNLQLGTPETTNEFFLMLDGASGFGGVWVSSN